MCLSVNHFFSVVHLYHPDGAQAVSAKILVSVALECELLPVPPTARISPCFPGNGVRKRTTDTDWILTEIEHVLNKIK